MAISTGPSIRAVVRVLNQSSCGSGSFCGFSNGKPLFLTNAHVAGTRLGRVVRVEHEKSGKKFDARVIMASYSDRTTSDWAVLEAVSEVDLGVEPVKLSKKPPSGSHYTKGFPRCRPHNGTDITTQSFRPPVWFWEPDAIGGQSGSGVWSDVDGFQYGLLTWQWGSNGAGQMTSEIYKQTRSRTNAGHARPEGLVELEDDYDLSDVDTSGLTDPEVENGFFFQTSIADLEIWAEDDVKPPVPPDEDENDDSSDMLKRDEFIEFCRESEEFFQGWKDRLEKAPRGPADNDDGTVTPPSFGM